MNIEYYGPTIEAEREINSLLNITATGKEQDWEIEFANPSLLDKMFVVLEKGELGYEAQSALALLIVSSIEEAELSSSLTKNHVRIAARVIGRLDDVRKRMEYYWLKLDRASNRELVKSIVGRTSV